MANAAETVVYVDAKAGNDSNAGTSASAAFKTLDAAYKKLATDGGVIVLTSDYTLSADYTTPNHNGQITITSKNKGTEYGGRLVVTKDCHYHLNGSTVFRDLTIRTEVDLYNALTFVCNFNPILFDDGYKLESKYNKKNVCVVGGYWDPKDASLKTDLDSSITVNSGDFYYLLGFSRKKSSAAIQQEYKGTSHITVNGGYVGKVYGGTSENHYGGSTVITVNGGTVSEIHTAGDVTRRLKGTATVNLNGGTVKTVDINNVMGDVKLNITGVSPSSVAVTYYSDTLKSDEAKAGGIKSVAYNSLICSQSVIDSFAKNFDYIENTAVIFVRAGAAGDGSTADRAIGSFSEAYGKLKNDGGRIVVVGEVKYDITASADGFGGKIIVEGQDSKSALKITGDACINTDTAFDKIKLTGDGTLYANFHELMLGTQVTGEGVSLAGSTASQGTGKVSLIVNGGSYKSIVGVAEGCSGFSSDINIVVGNVKSELVTLSASAAADIKNASLSVNDGEHKSVVVCKGGSVSDSLTVNLLGGKIKDTKLNAAKADFILNITHADFENAITVEELGGDSQKRKLVVSAGVDETKIAQVKASFPEAELDNTIYLKSGSSGNGRTPDTAVGSLNEAIKLLGGKGKIVVCGEYKLTTTHKLDEYTYPVLITSKGVGEDYREDGAKIVMEASLHLGGETTIENINFSTPKSNVVIYGAAHKLVIGEGVDTELTDGNTGYIGVVGGRNDNLPNKKIDVTVNSGTWGVLRAGSNSTSLYESEVEINVTVNGGTFTKYVAFASRGKNSKGVINATINGGTFYQSVYAVYEEDGKAYSADYDVKLEINGGIFYQMVAPACSFLTKLEGSYKVVLNGGDWTHLTDMLGTELYRGNMTSSIKVNPSANAASQVTGTDTFTNPVRSSGPDPWIFYYDGHYYYTHTTGKKIVLMKVQNISEIGTSAERVIIEPTEGQNMWSPEIHHFSAEEVGEENAGWYLYIGFDDGTTANQRQHVLKCLDGDNLLGRWGDPVTGKVNVPRKVEVPNAPHYNNDELCGGSSKIVINGKTYMTFVSEVGRGTADFHQTINITEIENPWTYKSVPTTICYPTYKWEEGGYGYSEAKDGWYPKVVEGASAVYSDNGDVYLMYTGSGYWTIYYQLGYLKFLGGDPMDANNWKKNPTSILSLSDEVNGCGHGSYFKDHEGNYYVAYHGYLGKDTSSGRYAHIERIYVTSEGIKIGNGSGHPAPLKTEYTITLNPTPLSQKISGFVSDKTQNNVDTPDTDVTDDTTPDTNVGTGGLSTFDAIVIMASAVVVVVCGVTVYLILSSKKSQKVSEKSNTEDKNSNE